MNKISMDKKYRTRDGHSVRILSIDRNYQYPVVALVTDTYGIDAIAAYSAYGKYFTTGADSQYDLIEVSPYDDFKIDDKVLVCRYEGAKWTKRYFAGVDENGNPMTYADGATSWSQHGTVSWKFCKKAED